MNRARWPPGKAVYRLPGFTPVALTRSSTEVARYPRSQNCRMAESRTSSGSKSRGRGTAPIIQERSFKNKLAQEVTRHAASDGTRGDHAGLADFHHALPVDPDRHHDHPPRATDERPD